MALPLLEASGALRATGAPVSSRLAQALALGPGVG